MAEEERQVVVAFDDGKVVVMGFDETGKYRKPEDAESGWIKVNL